MFACLTDKYVIIQASNKPAKSRKSDTLIRLRNKGGFAGFSFKNSLWNGLYNALTFNKDVAGSRPARPIT